MKQKILETLFKKLGVCNRILQKTFSEEEALKSICKYLVEELDFRLVWVGVPDYEKGLVKPLFWEGHEEDYLSEIEILLDPKSDEGKDLAATSIGEGKIAFVERSLKRGYLSGVCIPLFVKGKLKYLLNIYAKEANFFSEELSPFLNILKENLEYALERIEEEIYSKMFRIALEESDLFIFITDAEGTIKYLNPYM
ncbi:MAG: GAF domain-containing protein, partial [Thermodesulfobacteriaceae bacterium]|nr:GAF domain-containing protein [Thermodesulfobacteriaceae bacterium]